MELILTYVLVLLGPAGGFGATDGHPGAEGAETVAVTAGPAMTAAVAMTVGADEVRPVQTVSDGSRRFLTGPDGVRRFPPQDPAGILRRTSAAYEAMYAVKAEFRQELRNPLLGRTTRSAGTLYQREPDRFLMDYSDPEGDLIVSDGRYFWMYYPSVDARQVLRMPRGGQGLDLQAQFIGDPVARFEVTYHGTETVRGRTAHVMTLDPRESLGYERLKVWIDEEDHLVRRFELTEGNGNVRHMELRDLEVNPSLPDSLFEFTPPADAIVVERG